MRPVLLFCGFLMVLSVACKERTAQKSIAPQNIAFKKEGELHLLRPAGDTIKTLEIEIADNDYETQTGLMHRPSMLKNRGMLFIFEDERPHNFHMKNTLIPLDLIWVSADRKIRNITENAQPLDETLLPSQFPVQYVLEVNGGMVGQWGLKTGDSLTWQIF